MSQRVLIIVQARMGSTRLPGKVMKPLLGKPLLAHLLERLERVSQADQVVVATPEGVAEQFIVDLVERFPSVGLFRGSEHDVLARYHGAAHQFGGEVIVRVTSDCPLIDPNITGRCIEAFLADDLDYVSTGLRRTFPRGLDTEVFSLEALGVAFHEAVDPPEREHVTPFLYHRPERFRLFGVTAEEDRSDLRLTVDTPEDFELVRRIYETLYPEQPNFSFEDVLALLDKHPDWADINRHIEQKAYGR